MSGKLTAEQVREAIFNGSSYASYDGAKYYADGIGMQAIADELNATLGSGTCKVAACYDMADVYNRSLITEWYFAFSCGHELYWDESEPPKHCPECGKMVER